MCSRVIYYRVANPIGCLIFTGHFRKRALQLVALLRKMTCNLRHPMGLRHPVLTHKCTCIHYKKKHTRIHGVNFDYNLDCRKIMHAFSISV